MRRTKIVATLGPASMEPPVLKATLEAGMDVARLNFAHATPEIHARVAADVRREAEAIGRVVGILADLPGPKMRTGDLVKEEVVLLPGEDFVLSEDEVLGDWTAVSTNVESITSMVTAGDQIFLADGEIILDVEKVDDKHVHTNIRRGGTLRPRKGMHLPQAERKVEAFTRGDREALEHALNLGAEMIGLSFVRDADDVNRARAACLDRDPHPFLVAKIETRAALENLDEIVSAADIVMVARGDLGIQTELSQMPILQKDIIHRCNQAGKPVITATQMLESMTRNPIPTRAEVTDVANAVLDGTDALMLSEETAIGQYPASAVQTMSEIAESAEGAATRFELSMAPRAGDDKVAWAVAHAAVEAAEDLDVAVILCPTLSGATPRRVAAFRPRMRIAALSERRETLGALALAWGVTPLALDHQSPPRDANEEVARACAAAKSAGFAEPGDLVAVVAGNPGPRAGSTDFLRIVRI